MQFKFDCTSILTIISNQFLYRVYCCSCRDWPNKSSWVTQVAVCASYNIELAMQSAKYPTVHTHTHTHVDEFVVNAGTLIWRKPISWRFSTFHAAWFGTPCGMQHAAMQHSACSTLHLAVSMQVSAYLVQVVFNTLISIVTHPQRAHLMLLHYTPSVLFTPLRKVKKKKR